MNSPINLKSEINKMGYLKEFQMRTLTMYLTKKMQKRVVIVPSLPMLLVLIGVSLLNYSINTRAKEISTTQLNHQLWILMKRRLKPEQEKNTGAR